MLRLFLCVGLIAFGYYVGRKFNLQESVHGDGTEQEQ